MKREISFRYYAFATKEWFYYNLNEDNGPTPDQLGVYGGLSVPQQFTGVKDINGKKIYEGDIVWLDSSFCLPSWEKKNNIFEIVFHRGAFQLKAIKLSKASK